MERNMDMVTFTVIIDDIVYPDGHTRMACLGGGGPQTAFGARIWADENDKIGIASGIGSDFPYACKKWFLDMRIDTGGLLIWPSPTLRAWQVLEPDGRRTQVWRTALEEDALSMLRPPLSSLPATYRALVSVGNIFSANEKEASSLVGPGLPLEIIQRLTELGAKIVTLRRGPSGCIVHRSDTKETWEIPAFHSLSSSDIARRETVKTSNVKDPTGCGNTFCGAFLLGWWKTQDLLVAGLWGSVAASFDFTNALLSNDNWICKRLKGNEED
eukprot:TRINITY_DN9924_c0_g1_i1.p1 TRINITY_DN9924_c0_g1~~TRINITY_DN9924_c0_g1_i1.p1  ORF type:complete len:271 (+),score=63.27 TRINITY_DN9924_c0_g1_i1:69-881(+)